jgi:hypothetical protein
VAREVKKPHLGKGAAFVKARLKRLRQGDDTWEADFQALPKPITQSQTHYLGLVVVKKDGSVLAESQIEGRPSVNDLAALVVQAMCRPLAEAAHRPRRIQVRGHHQWRELSPHLNELGIDVSVRQALPKINVVYKDHLRQLNEARRAEMVKPTAEQAKVEELFPAVAQWVRGGHIEIGDQQSFGFLVRALDYGGVAFEDDRPSTLAEAMAALEKGLTEWFKEEGIEL